MLKELCYFVFYYIQFVFNGCRRWNLERQSNKWATRKDELVFGKTKQVHSSCNRKITPKSLKKSNPVYWVLLRTWLRVYSEQYKHVFFVKKRLYVYNVFLVTWLILPVVIRSSQRLSHACVSISDFILWNCERLIISVIVYLIIPYYLDNRSNSRANTCNNSQLLDGMYLLDINQPSSEVFGES